VLNIDEGCDTEESRTAGIEKDFKKRKLKEKCRSSRAEGKKKRDAQNLRGGCKMGGATISVISHLKPGMGGKQSMKIPGYHWEY